jgi:hypothetical protein
VLATLAGAGMGLGALHGRQWLVLVDRLILGGLLLVAAALALGPVLVLARGVGPADALHLVYAVVALLAMPLARLEAMRRRSARLGWWVCAGGLVTLGALLRLWATGG